MRKEGTVAYAYVQDAAWSWEQYVRIGAALVEPLPDGLIARVAGPTDEGVRVIDIWESEATWERFRAERLAPRSRRSPARRSPSRPSATSIRSRSCSATEHPSGVRTWRNDEEARSCGRVRSRRRRARRDVRSRVRRRRDAVEPQQAAAAATARYHSVEQALKDGYSGAGEAVRRGPRPRRDGIPLRERPADRGRGDRPAAAGDPALRPGRERQPEARGRRVLRRRRRSEPGHLRRPAVAFGQPFDGPMPGHSPGMPIHYDLHVWLWETNAGGLFAFNAALSC